MKLLSGSDIADFIQTRQLQQVRRLRQSEKVFPKLAIIRTSDDARISTYVNLKKRYGEDILIDVEVHSTDQDKVKDLIESLNQDDSIHGIIVQLPLADQSQTEQTLQLVAPDKDVDALGKNPVFDAATPTAINWLLAGYNIDMKDKNIAIIGNGRLVGGPLGEMWRKSGLNVTTIEKGADLLNDLKDMDIIVSATGSAGLLSSAVIPSECVVVDAGLSDENGTARGDLSDDVYEREDLKLTPKKGGVGPLTVSALFDNVIKAADLK